MSDNNYLEIRQRTEELLRQAFLVWQSSDYSEHLEKLADDPVFKMLITAMAYQFNETDSSLEFLKQQVKNDFAEMFIPYNVDRVQPATVVVENETAEGVPEVLMDDRSVFTERTEGLQFIPLLRTRVISASVSRIVRLDGRRWRITMSFPDGVTNLAGFTFAIKGLMFRDFSLYVDDNEIPLIKPWNQYDLPFTDAFAFAVRMYNRTPIFNEMSICLDLLAQQDLFLFSVAETASDLKFAEDTRSLDFVVEFKGIDENFVLDKSKLHLNVNVLVNAKINTVTLSHDKPVARVSEERGQKFMKLLAPSEEQVASNYNVYVRKVQADRFNVNELLKLVDCLLTKFHTDYYAFQLLKQQEGESVLHNVSTLMEKFKTALKGVRADDANGVYLFLRDENERVFKVSSSFDVRYLTTNGALPDGVLRDDMALSPPPGLDIARVRQIAKPVPGMDDKFESADNSLLTAYYITTSDRLVTPADMRLFCQYRLMAVLSLGRESFRDITVVRQPSRESYVGYEVEVRIVLANTPMVRKAVGDRLPRMECLLEKLIEVRSVNIYPTRVSIVLK